MSRIGYGTMLISASGTEPRAVSVGPLAYNSGDPNVYNYSDFTCGSVMLTPWTMSGVEFADPVVPAIPLNQTRCEQCGRLFSGFPWWGSGHDYVIVPSAYGPSTHHCYECAGYRRDLGRFENREDWIRESVPLRPDTDPLIVADWLEDHNRPKDAAYLRVKYLKQPDEGV